VTRCSTAETTTPSLTVLTATICSPSTDECQGVQFFFHMEKFNCTPLLHSEFRVRLHFVRLPSVVQQQNIMGFCWKSWTSATIPPTFSSDITVQDNKIGGITFSAALVTLHYSYPYLCSHTPAEETGPDPVIYRALSYSTGEESFQNPSETGSFRYLIRKDILFSIFYCTSVFKENQGGGLIYSSRFYNCNLFYYVGGTDSVTHRC